MNSADPITGEWDATMDLPDETREMTLMLLLDGKEVSGRVESSQGVSMFENGEFDQNRLRLYLPSDQGEIKLLAELDNRTLTGEYNIANRHTGAWQATKR